MITKKNKQNLPFSETIYVSIATFVIKIEFIYENYGENFVDSLYRKKLFKKNISKLLKNFIIPDIPKSIHFTILVKSEQTIFTRNKSSECISLLLFRSLSITKLETFYYINAYQFQLILRDIIFRLVTQSHGFILHASAVKIGDKACIFLGKSTSGKSTIVRLIKATYTPLADDTIVIKREKNKYYLYGTPFLEKQRWIKRENKNYELTYVMFIYKGKETNIKRVTNNLEILNPFLDQVFLSEDIKKNTFNLALHFLKSDISLYKLTFKKSKKDIEQVFLSLS